MDKSALRKIMLNKRKSLSQNECVRMSNMIFENLKSTEVLNYKNILVYADFNNEVKTDIIINYLLENERAVYLPKCDTTNETFTAVRIYKNTTNYFKNKYGITEPAESHLDLSPKTECVIVPGIAFDIHGNRIGFGCGYYDKFLKENPTVLKAALCYEFQIVDGFEKSEYDIPMDLIITEKRIVRIK